MGLVCSLRLLLDLLTMQTVNWVSGFSWICPHCSNENFGRLVEVDLQADAFPEHLRSDVEVMREEGMDACLVGLMMPLRVTCKCGARFKLAKTASE